VVAPPGSYYLVVNRKTAEGPVPSVARMVHVGETSDAAEALQPMSDDSLAPVGGSATADEDNSAAARSREAVGERAWWSQAP
jgi:hypothetical protein